LSRLRPVLLWAPVVAWMGLLFAASSQSELLGAPRIWDKAAHAGAYFVLAALALRALHGGRGPLRMGPSLGALLLAVLYGVSDEVHQAFVPGRTPSALDVLADGVGALAAVAGAWLWQRLRPRPRTPERSGV
jgi:VanZ family protein